MKPFIFLLAILFSIDLSAQVEREDPPNPNNPQIRINEHRIVGKVMDSKTGRPLVQ